MRPGVLATAVILCWSLLAAQISFAQADASQTAQNLQVAPEDRARMMVPPPYQVLGDKRVTFQISAPLAMSVQVQGEWPGGLAGNSTVPMSRNDLGVWSITVGPQT